MTILTDMQLRLYVAGNLPNSTRALSNVTEWRRHLPDGHRLEIVDVLHEPQRALQDGVFVTPTLLKLTPAPPCRVTGSLDDPAAVLDALGVASADTGNSPRPASPTHDDELVALVGQLEDIERKLHALAAGKADTVVGPAGQAYLLHEAQTQLLRGDSEQRLLLSGQASMLDASPAHAAVLDGQGTIVSVNKLWKRFASANGLRSGDFCVGGNYLQLCDAVAGEERQDAQRAAEGIRAALAGDEGEFGLEYPCHSPTEKRWYRMTVTPLRSEAGGGAIVMHLDISLRKQADEAMRRTSELLQAIVSGTPDSVFIKDRQGRYLLCNEAFARFAGRTVEQMIGQDSTSIFGVTNARKLIEIDQKILETGRVHTAESDLTGVDGARRFFTTKAPYRNERGEVIGIIGISRDITERRQAEIERDRGHQLLRTLIDALPDIVYTKDMQGRFLVCNRAALAFHGCEREHELAGKTVFDLLPLDAAQREHDDDLRVLNGQPVYDREERIAHPHEAARWHSTIKVPLRAAAGHIVGLVGICRDITERKRAQQESNELGERLASTLESLSDGFCTLDHDGRFTYVNRRAERLLRRARGELLGGAVWERLPELRSTSLDDALRQATQQSTAVHLVEHFAAADLWYEIRIHATRRGLAVFLRDVSKQHRLALQLEAERSRLIAAQAVAKIGSWASDLATGAAEWSQQTHRIFQTDPGTFKPTHQGFLALVHPDDRAAVGEAFVRSIGQTTTQAIEHRLVGSADTVVEERWQVLYDESGVPLRALGTSQDVTEQRRAERKLRESGSLLLMAGRLGHIGAWSFDLSQPHVVWSDEVCAIHEVASGTTPSLEEALAFYTPESLPLITRACQACSGEGVPFDLELEIETAQGRRLWVRAIGEAVRDAGGAIRGIQGAFQDLSERKEAEQETRALAARLTNTLESITDGFFTVDRQWRFTYVNREAERMVGLRRENMLGIGLWDVFPPAVGTDFERYYNRAVDEHTAVSFEAHYAPLNIWFRVNAYPFDDGLTVYCRDVTEERAARLQLELLEAGVSQLNDIVLITEAAPLDEPGPRIAFVNDAFVRITGYAREEVLGKSPRLLQGPRTDRGVLDELHRTLARFEPAHAELVNYSKSGEPYWIEMDIVPVGTPGEASSHFVAVERDITERKRDQEALRELNADLENRVLTRTAELNLARDEAEQANRAKSAFLATMSHELRTPMNGVIGMLDLLDQTSLRSDQVDMLDLVRDSALSLLTIIDDILDFSKIEAGKLSIEQASLRIEEVVEKVCGMLDHMAVNRGVWLAVFVEPAVPPIVCGDALRLRQVLINLVGNAIKFSSGLARAGRVSVRVVLAERQDDAVAVDFIVADNGIGIDDATLSRLFTPFSQADASTTRRFGGTGLGLAISNMLVELMGGRITVRSAPDAGSTFSVRLRFARTGALDGDSPDSALALVDGLHCRLVGGDLPLADDLGAYLAQAGVRVSRSPDLAAAARVEQAAGLWLWLILPGEPVLSLEELRAIAPGRPRAETRFIVLGRGRRRRPRVDAADFISIDADAMSRKTLFKLIALAAGRLREESGDADGHLGSHGNPAPQVGRPALQQRPGRPAASTHEGRILVAEDNETNRLVIRQQLELLGFSAEIVVDGHDALERWRRGGFALLLTDLHMPKMDGYALAAAIRAEEPAGSRIPIIALTANTLSGEESRCRAAGMDGYLTKPVRLPQLKAAIEARLGPAAQAGAAADAQPPAAATAAIPAAAAAAAALAEASVPPADLTVLADMVGNDPAVIDEVLQSFRKTASLSTDEINRGAAAGALQAVANAAHKLKSAARWIGALRLGETCSEIEQAAEGGEAAELKLLLARFQAEHAALAHFLDSR